MAGAFVAKRILSASPDPIASVLRGALWAKISTRALTCDTGSLGEIVSGGSLADAIRAANPGDVGAPDEPVDGQIPARTILYAGQADDEGSRPRRPRHRHGAARPVFTMVFPSANTPGGRGARPTTLFSADAVIRAAYRLGSAIGLGFRKRRRERPCSATVSSASEAVEEGYPHGVLVLPYAARPSPLDPARVVHDRQIKLLGRGADVRALQARAAGRYVSYDRAQRMGSPRSLDGRRELTGYATIIAHIETDHYASPHRASELARRRN